MVKVFCAKCGKEFDARDMRVRFCDNCKEAKNKKELKYCLVCGKPIVLGKYCSNECRKKIQAQKIKEHNANTHGLRIDKELYNRFVSQLAGKNPVNKIEELIKDFLDSDSPF